MSLTTKKSIKYYIVCNFNGDNVLFNIPFNIYNALNTSEPP